LRNRGGSSPVNGAIHSERAAVITCTADMINHIHRAKITGVTRHHSGDLTSLVA
jgi:hypothetical protein